MKKTSIPLSFEFIGNACGVFIGKEGSRILCDPWINDGVFDGSWCHYPPLKTTFADIKNVNAIYISHLHPDHFDDRFFSFDKDIPIIVLDHGPNFLRRRLDQLGYKNLISIKDGETKTFREFELTMFAPFTKHNFHDATIGNLIDSALVVNCDGIVAFNANDNTPTVEACTMLRKRFGNISLAMINYNAAGPYPSCFDNLTEEEKRSESQRILNRNFEYMRALIQELKPERILPFAGAYVLGGDLWPKNEYLGTTTWDKCAEYLRARDIGSTQVTLMREGDVLDLKSGITNREYQPICDEEMSAYISGNLSQIRYPYQFDKTPDTEQLYQDIEVASEKLSSRMEKFGLKSSFKVFLHTAASTFEIYPSFSKIDIITKDSIPRLECKMDDRLLRRILDRKSHWNNSEIGAHISFNRNPNSYEPDLHTGLQFFHL